MWHSLSKERNPSLSFPDIIVSAQRFAKSSSLLLGLLAACWVGQAGFVLTPPLVWVAVNDGVPTMVENWYDTVQSPTSANKVEGRSLPDVKGPCTNIQQYCCKFFVWGSLVYLQLAKIICFCLLGVSTLSISLKEGLFLPLNQDVSPQLI